ncbi:hypothetical protein [Paraprevotella clara]|uniref:hypothetical protein n=1 Tax=Paraprevotella clara TaxID=454154 RepID=UPI00266BA7CA|nr:hypothetical protein [Paraprevotella clara]
MRKKIFFALLSVVCFSWRASAQSSLLATLNHEGTISTYYGSSALQEAYHAADHGDVITLSSGSFLGTDIQKAITLRGAGMTVDTVAHTEPTVISTNFTIDVSDTLSHRLTLEGIYSNQTVRVSTLKNAMFLKCRFKEINTYSSNSTMKDLNFIHCRIAERFYLAANGSASFLNCVVMNPYQGNSNNSVFSFTNCYVNKVDISYSEYKNCIINNTYSGTSTTTYYNNLWLCNGGYSLNSPNNTNVKISETDERVSFLNVDYNDDNDYQLTDAVRALIKGTDGTEVGIYGGSLPYDPTPTNPQITKFNVAAKSTADGKLSVDIEVNSAN